MNTGMIPVRYAKALFEFATEKGCDGRVYGQMGKLAAAFVREPELRRVLDNPVLPESEKLKLVYAACGGDPGEVLERFAQLVLHNRRERFLQWIALMYREQYRKAHGISTGRLETARPGDARYRAPPEGADRGADAREARAGGFREAGPDRRIRLRDELRAAGRQRCDAAAQHQAAVRREEPADRLSGSGRKC